MRPDVTIAEVIQMVMGISKIPVADRDQVEHILRIALDGLRYRPEGRVTTGVLVDEDADVRERVERVLGVAAAPAAPPEDEL